MTQPVPPRLGTATLVAALFTLVTGPNKGQFSRSPEAQLRVEGNAAGNGGYRRLRSPRVEL